MGSVQPLPRPGIAYSHTACASCGLRAGCLPAGLNVRELARFDSLITPRHRVRRGQHLCRTGTALQSLFVIRSGAVKSCVTDDDGRVQIMGFYLAGELLGMDAIATGRHICDVIALEDSEVCNIPFAGLQQLSRDIPALGHDLHCMMSREIGRGYGVMLLLGTMRADERLAAFLLNLSQRFLARGYSPSNLVLRMPRREIGSYLGLKLETVSRTLSGFQREALIAVRRKDIRIIDLETLKAIMQGADPQFRGLPADGDAAAMTSKFPARMPWGHAAAPAGGRHSEARQPAMNEFVRVAGNV